MDNIKSLENIGLDLSFINNLKIDLGLKSEITIDQSLRKTGGMIEDLAALNYERLSTQPSLTITDAPQPTQMELQLANNICQELNQQIIKMDAKPVINLLS